MAAALAFSLVGLTMGAPAALALTGQAAPGSTVTAPPGLAMQPAQFPSVPDTAPPGWPTTTAPPTTTTTVAGHTTTTVKGKTTTTVKGGTTTTVPATTTTTVSPAQVKAMEAIANSVRRFPGGNDRALLAALSPLEQMGFNNLQAEVLGMGQFPVAGPATWSDDWLEYRSAPSPHNHQGIDIEAALGTPIRAPVAGTLVYSTTDPDGYGLAAEVTGADKTMYLMAHMSAAVKGLASGATVTEGEIVGYVGESGDASGPHVHFEVHPRGGNAVDADPILNAWVSAAIKGMPAVIATLATTTTTTATTTPGAPAQQASPKNQSLFPNSSPVVFNPTKPAPSVAGPALAGLLALLFVTSLAAVRFRPWPLPVKAPASPGGRPADPPTPAH